MKVFENQPEDKSEHTVCGIINRVEKKLYFVKNFTLSF